MLEHLKEFSIDRNPRYQLVSLAIHHFTPENSIVLKGPDTAHHRAYMLGKRTRRKLHKHNHNSAKPVAVETAPVPMPMPSFIASIQEQLRKVLWREKVKRPT